MRIGLGCMRLSTERRARNGTNDAAEDAAADGTERDDASAVALIERALDAGFDVVDTAHAYARDASDVGHNERLVARAVAAVRARRGNIADAGAPAVRVITKCGMRRDGGAWLPDGRASAILDDAHASTEALGGVGIDLLLLHAPDPRTSLATTARALAKAQADGLTRAVGASNVTRKQLEEIAAVVPVAAVEVALGAYDDLAIRSGVVAYCIPRGIELFAHAPLGGPQRVARLARDGVLRKVAAARSAGGAREGRGATPIEIFLAYLLAVRPELVPIVGVRRVETIDSLVKAAHLVLDDEELLAIDARFPVLASVRRPPTAAAAAAAAASRGERSSRPARELVMMMGVPGAGKSRAAEALVAGGYERLNRDILGGTLRGIVERLDQRLRAGADRLVLDNTYVSRASRNDVLRTAAAHDVEVRCVFFDTPPHEASSNVVHRMLERFGRVLDPSELAAHAKRDPAALSPRALQRMTRDLERPAEDEGFASIEVIPFERDHGAAPRRGGLAMAVDVLGPAAASFSLDAIATAADVVARAAPLPLLGASTATPAPLLLYAWRPGATADARARADAFAAELARVTGAVVEVALCTHGAGPSVCWCRPPLPALWLAFARRHGIDVRESILVGTSATDAAMARALGMRFARHEGA